MAFGSFPSQTTDMVAMSGGLDELLTASSKAPNYARKRWQLADMVTRQAYSIIRGITLISGCLTCIVGLMLLHCCRYFTSSLDLEGSRCHRAECAQANFYEEGSTLTNVGEHKRSAKLHAEAVQGASYASCTATKDLCSGAATVMYKALYENELEINRRVFTELMELERRLADTMLHHCFHQRECCSFASSKHQDGMLSTRTSDAEIAVNPTNTEPSVPIEQEVTHQSPNRHAEAWHRLTARTTPSSRAFAASRVALLRSSPVSAIGKRSDDHEPESSTHLSPNKQTEQVLLKNPVASAPSAPPLLLKALMNPSLRRKAPEPLGSLKASDVNALPLKALGSETKPPLLKLPFRKGLSPDSAGTLLAEITNGRAKLRPRTRNF